MLPVIVAIMAALPISSAAMAVSMDSDVPLAITAVARASTGQPIVLVSSAGATPGTWLGVRMSPVPRPLAAHLDTPGVMVTNVVRESPADAAGLQQFDVITQLNGKAVAAPEDLVNAIKDLPVGQTVTLTLVRKAAAQQVRVTLGERPADRELAMKFDEPEDPVWNDAFSITGRKFLFSPDGQFQIKNLGPLDDLKDVIIDLQGMPPFGVFFTVVFLTGVFVRAGSLRFTTGSFWSSSLPAETRPGPVLPLRARREAGFFSTFLMKYSSSQPSAKES